MLRQVCSLLIIFPICCFVQNRSMDQISFGCKDVSPSTGLVLNNHIRNYDYDGKVPGWEFPANVLSPGKRHNDDHGPRPHRGPKRRREAGCRGIRGLENPYVDIMGKHTCVPASGGKLGWGFRRKGGKQIDRCITIEEGSKTKMTDAYQDNSSLDSSPPDNPTQTIPQQDDSPLGQLPTRAISH